MKTYEQINDRIESGKAIVLTADEIMDYVDKKGLETAAKEVDVVTTGTFAPMCSSGAYINIGHATPRIKLGGGSMVKLSEALNYSLESIQNAKTHSDLFLLKDCYKTISDIYQELDDFNHTVIASRQ